ncbi:lipid A export permease/ATP-binding protein MsbA [Aliikangiella maris]|uniref:Lipid A export permease/ATP-binding protein MsbA n=2 Tax=Aliikangiella maris TaxID=3162458 RepID=A0ABV3MQY1_9GAMM
MLFLEPQTLQVVKRLWCYFVCYKAAITLMIFALIAFSLIDGGMLYLIKPLIDEGVTASNGKNLVTGGFILIGLFFLRGVTSFVADYLTGWISLSVIQTLRQTLFKHYIQLPQAYFDQQKSGRLIAKITFDIEQISQATTDTLVVLIRESITLLVLLGLMLYASWQLSVLLFLIGPIIAFIMTQVSSQFRQKSRNLQDSMGEVTRIAEQLMRNHRDILTLTTQDYEQFRFSEANRKSRQRAMKLTLITAACNPVIQMIAAVATAIILWLASVPEIINQLSTGAFTLTLVAMGSLLKPLKQLSKINEKLQRGLAAAQSVFEVLDYPVEADYGMKNPQGILGKIQVNELNFAYLDDQKNVLKSINLSINPGESVALVGESGCGKSTLVHLLLRLYDCPVNHVFIDGHEINSLSLNSLRGCIAYVSQQVQLIDGSIAENIAYGNINYYHTEKIRHAAIVAGLSKLIDSLAQGLDTPIGENGCQLSGGQRQRIAIARAIYRDAPIMILDEATSALDNQSEQMIKRTLNQFRGNKTLIVIAHRLSAIEMVDRIIVLNAGTIVEQGSHHELLLNNGYYSQLYHGQAINH